MEDDERHTDYVPSFTYDGSGRGWRAQLLPFAADAGRRWAGATGLRLGGAGPAPARYDGSGAHAACSAPPSAGHFHYCGPAQGADRA